MLTIYIHIPHILERQRIFVHVFELIYQRYTAVLVQFRLMKALVLVQF